MLTLAHVKFRLMIKLSIRSELSVILRGTRARSQQSWGMWLPLVRTRFWIEDCQRFPRRRRHHPLVCDAASVAHVKKTYLGRSRWKSSVQNHAPPAHPRNCELRSKAVNRDPKCCCRGGQFPEVCRCRTAESQNSHAFITNYDRSPHTRRFLAWSPIRPNYGKPKKDSSASSPFIWIPTYSPSTMAHGLQCQTAAH